ncbi:hypothetical protein D9613_001926 [Agrocybe pediades]|uniref:Uncharacterized protein n=1 Tax=Agrocybe pediades TaxID=84607 RepID=A0A8H4VUX3_9AGAR|nr:hypothetical protein D9613_001926 [Agrocybe pediades]
MSPVTALLPASFSLSGDAAIEAILSDIPLFCEGIMGIGVFTFYCITKQVKLLSVFLYGSSFLAFAAATFDLGQVLSRGPQNTANCAGLDTVTAFIYAREVFLSLSIGLLDLFFWRLVAHCPQSEVISQPTVSQRGKAVHSASWSRWGLVGSILKWTSLAALLSVPLLQILWRLLPEQRKYGSIYVADSTIQTSIMVIFILKFILNIVISPNDLWSAFRAYMVPIGALVLGTGLGIANFVTFAFTETALGRFLRAVEVYLLILHSLYTTFQDIVSPPPPSSNLEPFDTAGSRSGKFKGDNILPIAFSYPVQDTSNKPQSVANSGYRASTLSWILPRRGSPDEVQRVDAKAHNSEKILENAPSSREYITQNIRPLSSVSTSSDSLQGEEVQPSAVLSLSYYTMEDASRLPQQAVSSSANQQKMEDHPGNGYLPSRRHPSPSLRRNFAKNPSPQGSVTSIDNLLREQSELDRSIAALRVLSSQGLGGFEEAQNPFSMDASREPTSRIVGQSGNTSRSHKTESVSNRSDFSLSVFPDPPVALEAETATRYSKINPPAPLVTTRIEGKRNPLPITIPSPTASPAVLPTAPLETGATQYDVTSFIGDLSNNPLTGALSAIESGSGSETETAEITTADTAVVLRPMILATMTVTSPTEYPILSASTYGPDTRASTIDSTPSLRPLLLGQRNSSLSKLGPSGTVVPLAQRRKRGISNATNRPVISGPRLSKERTEVAPGAFERPRPPPLRLGEAL